VLYRSPRADICYTSLAKAHTKLGSPGTVDRADRRQFENLDEARELAPSVRGGLIPSCHAVTEARSAARTGLPIESGCYEDTGVREMADRVGWAIPKGWGGGRAGAQ